MVYHSDLTKALKKGLEESLNASGAGLNLNVIDVIVIQRRATTEEAFEMLGWVELETRRKAHTSILVFKYLNDLIPPYLSNYFIRNSTIDIHKTRQRNDIHLPNPKLTREKNI